LLFDFSYDAVLFGERARGNDKVLNVLEEIDLKVVPVPKASISGSINRR